jgi:acetyltransferase-like isoleucine patch superfamily enzyme
MIFIHKMADVLSTNIGDGTKIWQYSVVLKDAKIGNDCNICALSFIENDVTVGDNVTIKNGVYLWDGISVGNNVFIGPNVTFTNDKYPRSKQSFELRRTEINSNASLGAGSVVLCGLKIGSYSMVGAGSVVTKDVPPFTLWVGNPARHKGFVTRTGIILSLDLFDKNGVKYKIVNGEPVL